MKCLREIKNVISAWLKLKYTNISTSAFILFVHNVIGIVLVVDLLWIFCFHTHKNIIIDNNKLYWDNIAIIWGVVAMLITALTFVLSIYLPPVIKEVKDLSAGIKPSCRNRIIHNNKLSVNIFQMIVSIVIIIFLLIVILKFCGIAGTDLSLAITRVIRYSIIAILLWVVSIWALTCIDNDNYTSDCLLLLPIDKKNQTAYFTLIKRQLDKHLSKKEYYRLNDDLIQVVRFITKNIRNDFYSLKDYSIKYFFNSKFNQRQYINCILNTYDNPVRFYYFSRDAITRNDFSYAPNDNITRFQNYMFSVKYRGIQEFYTKIVQRHVELTADNQDRLIDYY